MIKHAYTYLYYILNVYESDKQMLILLIVYLNYGYGGSFEVTWALFKVIILLKI